MRRATETALRPLSVSCLVAFISVFSIGHLTRVYVSQVEPAQHSWKVEFRRTGRGEPLYTTVDQRRGTVQDFTDHRCEKALGPRR